MMILQRALKKTGVYLLAGIIALFTIFPFYWIVVLSFRRREDIFSASPKLTPDSLSLDNYARAFKENNIGLFLLNSFYIVAVSVFVAVVISAFAAYALARFRFRGRDTMQRVIIATQVFPTIVILVPLY